MRVSRGHTLPPLSRSSHTPFSQSSLQSLPATPTQELCPYNSTQQIDKQLASDHVTCRVGQSHLHVGPDSHCSLLSLSPSPSLCRTHT